MKQKETKAERDQRIKESENGRRFFTRVKPNKKKDSKWKRGSDSD